MIVICSLVMSCDMKLFSLRQFFRSEPETAAIIITSCLSYLPAQYAHDSQPDLVIICLTIDLAETVLVLFLDAAVVCLVVVLHLDTVFVCYLKCYI